MSRCFSVVRPYDNWLRERVFEFLASLGYLPANASCLPAGTPDAEAVEWVDTQRCDLLLLPYNKHRSTTGVFVDGIGVAGLLSQTFADRAIPILMPIAEFSMLSSFKKRFAELEAKRPEIAELMIPMPESEVGAAEIAARVREIAAFAP